MIFNFFQAYSYSLVLALTILIQPAVHSQSLSSEAIPFSTNSDMLTVWNGEQYVPFRVNGINLGISVPGTFPGELAASRSQYAQWFTDIKAAGFNCIRLYTLHYPHFYEVLDSFNTVNRANPLLFFQGIWLNEELPGMSEDLYLITDSFRVEIEENVDCVHGNRVIPARYGKAFGTFERDASEWCLGYIAGREVYPGEILTTNQLHAGDTYFLGDHFAIQQATASEVWFTSMLDHIVKYELQKYRTQRPVSMSSWPTLDPLHHPEEPNRDEDTASIDLSKIQRVNAPAGLFISYHAYPYYPDFVSNQSGYQLFGDDYGLNTYLGYLTDLKSHYQNYPLIIAELGVPSSWGIAHYSNTGMNHGGVDEKKQGDINIRMLHTAEKAGCGGGILFAWMDEWFKRTWITDPIDYDPARRVLWHNVTAAEQNFGLIGFSGNPHIHELEQYASPSPVTSISAGADFSFLEMEVGIDQPLGIPDEMWVLLDTYSDTLGESLMPDGDTIPCRSEFALHITNYDATLFVTEAYDLYGIWHGISGPEQLFHSVASDGRPWRIVRWKNNSFHSSVQFIGNLRLNPDFQPPSSMDAVTLSDNKIRIRLPWSLINVVDPGGLRVFHDDRGTPQPEDTVTDGFRFSILYKDQWYVTGQRFLWQGWNTVSDSSAPQRYKTSYWVIKDRMHEFNCSAVAYSDTIFMDQTSFPQGISADSGILKNDFDLDGDFISAILTENPAYGQIALNNDGSFSYIPIPGFKGYDHFKYRVFDGYTLSTEVQATLVVTENETPYDYALSDLINLFHPYPSPSHDNLTIKLDIFFDELLLFSDSGNLVVRMPGNLPRLNVDVSELSHGTYFVVAFRNGQSASKKIVIY